jgi:hypothetical protein
LHNGKLEPNWVTIVGSATPFLFTLIFFLSKSETENKRIQNEVIWGGGFDGHKTKVKISRFLYWVLNA